jgi:hypothetical protein
MCSFINDFVFHTCKSVEDDCSGSTFNIVHRRLTEGEEERSWDSPPADVV